MPAYYSKETNTSILYIHIPKCGGGSIEEFFKTIITGNLCGQQSLEAVQVFFATHACLDAGDLSEHRSI